MEKNAGKKLGEHLAQMSKSERRLDPTVRKADNFAI